MSEAVDPERAAKAARAKEKLRRFQAQKSQKQPTTSTPTTSTPPNTFPSAPSSPARSIASVASPPPPAAARVLSPPPPPRAVPQPTQQQQYGIPSPVSPPPQSGRPRIVTAVTVSDDAIPFFGSSATPASFSALGRGAAPPGPVPVATGPRRIPSREAPPAAVQASNAVDSLFGPPPPSARSNVVVSPPPSVGHDWVQSGFRQANAPSHVAPPQAASSQAQVSTRSPFDPPTPPPQTRNPPPTVAAATPSPPTTAAPTPAPSHAPPPPAPAPLAAPPPVAASFPPPPAPRSPTPSSPPNSTSTGVVVSPPEPSSPVESSAASMVFASSASREREREHSQSHSQTQAQNKERAEAEAQQEALLQRERDNAQREREEAQRQMDSQKATIELLVNEKHALVARARELEGALHGSAATQDELSRAMQAHEDTARLLRESQAIQERLKSEGAQRDARIAQLERESEVSRHATNDTKQALLRTEKAWKDTIAELKALQGSTALADLESKLRQKADHAAGLELELSKAKASAREALQARDALEASVGQGRSLAEGATAQLEQVTRERDAVSDKVERLEARLESSDKQLKLAQTESEANGAGLASVQAELDVLRETVSTTDTKLAATTAALEASEKVAEAAAARRDGLQAENTDLLASLEELRGKVVSLSDSGASQTDKIAHLNATLRDRDGTITSLEAKLTDAAEVATELAELRAEHDDALLTAEGLVEDMTKREEEVKTLEEELDSVKGASAAHLRTVASLEEDLAEFKKNAGTAAAERHDLLAQVDTHKASLVELTTDRDAHSARAESLAGKIAGLEQLIAARRSGGPVSAGEYEALQSQYDALQKGHEQAVAALAEAQQSIANHREAFLDAESERIHASERAEEAEAATRELREHVKLTKDARALLEKDVTRLKNETKVIDMALNAWKKEATDSRVILAQRARDNEGQLGTINKQRADLASLLSTAAAANRKVIGLTKDLAQREVTIQTTAAEASKWKTAVATLRAEVDRAMLARQAAESLLKDVKVGGAFREAEIGELKSQLAAKTSTVDSLEQALEKAERELDEASAARAAFEADSGSSGDRVRALEASLERVTQDSNQYSNRVAEVEHALSAAQQAHSALQSSSGAQVAELTDQLATAQSDADEAARTRAQLEQDAAKLRAKLEALQSTQDELVSAKATLSSVEQQLANNAAELTRVSSARAELEATNASLNKALGEVRASIGTEQESAANAAAAQAGERLKDEIEALRKKVTEAQVARKEAEENWAQVRGVAEEKSAKLGVSEAELESVRDELRAVEDQLNEARAEANEARAATNQLKRGSLNVSSEVVTLKEELTRAEAGKSSLAEQVVLLQRQLKEKEALLNEAEVIANKELETVHGLAKERHQALNAAVRRASKSERELKAVMASGGERDGEAAQLRAAVDKLEQDLARLRLASEGSASEVIKLTDELERYVAESESLKVMVAEKSDEADEAQRAVEELSGALESTRDELEEARRGVSPRPPSLSGALAPPGADYGREGVYDRDYVDSVQQQHELDLSAARTQIRALEDRVFTAEDTAHVMLKQNGDLKAEVEGMLEALSRERERSREAGLSPAPSPRIKQESPEPAHVHDHDHAGHDHDQHDHDHDHSHDHEHDHEHDHDHAHDHSHEHKHTPAPLPTPAHQPRASVTSSTGDLPLDADLPPHTRHARRESLHHLKMRMNQEGVQLNPTDETVPPLPPLAVGGGVSERQRGMRTRRAVLGEDLIWCERCEGDLFVV